jgi:hypothetical protein
VTVSQGLLIWGTDEKGIASYDSVMFFCEYVPQQLFTAMLINKDGFIEPQISWDLGLLDVKHNAEVLPCNIRCRDGSMGPSSRTHPRRVRGAWKFTGRDLPAVLKVSKSL